MVSTCLMLLPGVRELSGFHAASMVQQSQQMPSPSASLQAPTELQSWVELRVHAVRLQLCGSSQYLRSGYAVDVWPRHLAICLRHWVFTSNCLCGLPTPARPHRCLSLSIVLQQNFDVNASKGCVSTAAQMTSDMPVAQPQYPAAVQVYPVC